MTIKLLSQAATEMIIAKPDKTEMILQRIRKLVTERYPRIGWSDLVERIINGVAKKNNIVRYKIISAREVTKEEISKISPLVGEKTDVVTIIDERLLGGIIIKTLDKQLDLSLRNKINTLKTEFTDRL